MFTPPVSIWPDASPGLILQSKIKDSDAPFSLVRSNKNTRIVVNLSEDTVQDGQFQGRVSD